MRKSDWDRKGPSGAFAIIAVVVLYPWGSW